MDVTGRYQNLITFLTDYIYTVKIKNGSAVETANLASIYINSDKIINIPAKCSRIDFPVMLYAVYLSKLL